MARKHKHEEHLNHEAWAIPYGDLVTLLLALFVVMYAVSSVNEGKYRVLADAMSEAFGGPPRSMKPIQMGTQQRGEDQTQQIRLMQPRGTEKKTSVGGEDPALQNRFVHPPVVSGGAGEKQAREHLQRMAEAVEQALGDLISRDLVVVKRTDFWLEIEIRTDILFSSGSASVAETAWPVMSRLASILRPFDNTLRIEGHTDNVPISTATFPSNWELSAARAASVVHLFMREGVDPGRMTVAGFGEYHPAGDNATNEGRNHNRRVVIVVLADSQKPAPDLGGEAALRKTSTNTNTRTVVVPEGTLERLRQGTGA
ncbi:flagellar motor protein MotD [Solimonas sp. K1W22B-7]|uniref:flagellar motor protein MotD n=1 Tax=Solimonas sp. K1W22B-7 TaxID=2303331 RepID=UPI000E333FF4|nr:flagellar motor protein MotD [Solimonas sp. K1W22B-7]AXQ28209.1 flagellar motor protein MotD [Solimonas sp. K1W22B-7]